MRSFKCAPSVRTLTPAYAEGGLILSARPTGIISSPRASVAPRRSTPR
jgi:hypothetical protein